MASGIVSSHSSGGRSNLFLTMAILFGRLDVNMGMATEEVKEMANNTQPKIPKNISVSTE